MATRKQTTTAPRPGRKRGKQELSGDLVLRGLERAIQEQDEAARERGRNAEKLAVNSPYFAHRHSATAGDCTMHLRYQRQPNHVFLTGPTLDEVTAGLKAQVTLGLVALSQYKSFKPVFSLTAKAKRRLAKLRRENLLPELPPTPAWREWNRLRLYAQSEYPRTRKLAERYTRQQLARLPGLSPGRAELRRFQKSGNPTEYLPSMDSRTVESVNRLHHLANYLLAPEPPKY